MKTALDRTFFARSALEVAPDLLNKLFVVGGRSIRLTETEAYTRDDPASHSFRGRTNRNAVMFGRPGSLYVYFTYGMHWCANVVTGRGWELDAAETEAGEAVLLRCGLPVDGEDEIRAARPKARRDGDLANGPAKLAQALGIDGSFNGIDLCAGSGPALIDDGTRPLRAPSLLPRVGITKAVDRLWRFVVTD